MAGFGSLLGLVEATLDWRKSVGQPCPGVLEEPPSKLLWQSGHSSIHREGIYLR